MLAAMGDDLTFICGGLEPGTNGVGDHVALLAGELARGGRRVSLLAYADKAVETPVCETRRLGGQDVACLRLPAARPGAQRLAAARAFLDERAPGTVSLHYVCFAFDPRGLPLRENGRLTRLLAGHRTHLMMHELWVGLDDEAPVKLRLLGSVQRLLIAGFLARTPVEALDTSIPVFQRELARLGHRAGRLPIFANLPRTAGPEAGWFEAELATQGLPRETLRFVAFGSLPDSGPPERLFARIEAWAAERGRPACVLALGRLGPGGALLPAWRERFPALRFLDFGPQPGERIVDALEAADYGFSTFPLWVAGKSGSMAAALERGLPLVVGHVGRAGDERSVPDDVADLVIRADLADSALPAPRREQPSPRRIDRLAETARRYEALLGGVCSAAAD